MEKLNYKIDVFEGPMDLLLHLISKHKININDIPIVELVNQYIDYVRQMQEQDFDVAGEFLEMAARLIYIKTVSLLPKHEEAEILKKELTGELIEYRDCKLMAEKPEQAMMYAVKGMLPNNTVGRTSLTRLRVYKGAEHEHAAQKPEMWTQEIK